MKDLFITLFFHRLPHSLLLTSSMAFLVPQHRTLGVISNFSVSLMPTFNWLPSTIDSVMIRFLLTFSRLGLEGLLSLHTALSSACHHPQAQTSSCHVSKVTLVTWSTWLHQMWVPDPIRDNQVICPWNTDLGLRCHSQWGNFAWMKWCRLGGWDWHCDMVPKPGNQ